MEALLVAQRTLSERISQEFIRYRSEADAVCKASSPQIVGDFLRRKTGPLLEKLITDTMLTVDHVVPSAHAPESEQLQIRGARKELITALHAYAENVERIMTEVARTEDALRRASHMEPQWAVTPDAKQQYDTILERMSNGLGVVSEAQARELFARAALPPSQIDAIWRLADCGADGRLDSEEFALAMHLVNCARAGQPPPAALPPELIPPSARARLPAAAVSLPAHSSSAAHAPLPASVSPDKRAAAAARLDHERARLRAAEARKEELALSLRTTSRLTVDEDAATEALAEQIAAATTACDHADAELRRVAADLQRLRAERMALHGDSTRSTEDLLKLQQDAAAHRSSLSAEIDNLRQRIAALRRG